MNRRNFGTVAVAIALVTLFLLALVLAQAQGKLTVLALDLTEHLFGIVLAVFVFERLLAWREERRWLAAKNWLYMILLETIDDLLKELLPARVPKVEEEDTREEEKEEEEEEQISVYEVSGERIHFGEAVAYSPLRLLVSPDERELQSHIRYYVHRVVGAPQYADVARAALSDAREQIRDMLASSGQLLEAEITAMVMSLDQAIAAAIRHLDSAASMREEKLEDGEHLDGEHLDGGEGSAKQRSSRRRTEEEIDHQLAFVSSIIVESVVDSAIKPKAWLEEEIQKREGGSSSPLWRLGRAGTTTGGVGVGSTKQRH